MASSTDNTQTNANVLGLPRAVVDAALKDTAAEVTQLVGSTPNSNLYQYGGAIARTAVAFYAGRGVGWALDVSGDEATLIGGILACLLVLAWSVMQKKWAAWRTNQTAKASAAASAQATILAGAARTVVLEPPPAKV